MQINAVLMVFEIFKGIMLPYLEISINNSRKTQFKQKPSKQKFKWWL